MVRVARGAKGGSPLVRRAAPGRFRRRRARAKQADQATTNDRRKVGDSDRTRKTPLLCCLAGIPVRTAGSGPFPPPPGLSPSADRRECRVRRIPGRSEIRCRACSYALPRKGSSPRHGTSGLHSVAKCGFHEVLPEGRRAYSAEIAWLDNVYCPSAQAICMCICTPSSMHPGAENFPALERRHRIVTIANSR